MEANKFIEILKKSELLDDAAVNESIRACRDAADDAPLSDARQIGEFLVEQGTITRWHCDKIYSGKYRGFFLGKYKLLGHLGTGGMSSVYLAEHMLMRQKRAIKVLPRKRHTDKAYLDRFYLEARASAALHHPNIVQAYDVDSEGSTHYLVMEYVKGKDISLLVKSDGPLPFEFAANFAAQAANGLQYAHDQGLIHRDIKPGNLLVDDEGVVKILDMGLALFLREEESLTVANNEKVLGTADYLAPEQALNSHTVDHRADLYSLGCSLYFMLTGHAPFPEGSIAQRIAAHQAKAPEPIRVSRPECPGDLIEICNKLLEKNPDDRYQRADELLEVLDRWLIRNGYRRSGDPRKLRTGVASGIGESGLDGSASSSARLMAGVGQQSKAPKKSTPSPAKQDESPSSSSNTDPVNETVAETRRNLPASDAAGTSDIPELPPVSPSESASQSSSASSLSKSGSSSDIARQNRAGGSVAKRWLPEEIELEGLAELEADCNVSQQTESGPFVTTSTSGPRGGSGVASAAAGRPARTPARQIAGMPVWLFCTVLGLVGIVLLSALIAIAVVVMNGDQDAARNDQALQAAEWHRKLCQRDDDVFQVIVSDSANS